MRLTESVQRYLSAWWPRKKGCLPSMNLWSFLEPLTVDGFITKPKQQHIDTGVTTQSFPKLILHFSGLCCPLMYKKEKKTELWHLMCDFKYTVVQWARQSWKPWLSDGMHICCRGGQWYKTCGLHWYGLSYSYEAWWTFKISLGVGEMAQWLGAHTAFAKDSYQLAHNSP